MAGMKTVSKKKQQLIEKATELFCLYGIRRVTIEEICRGSNVSKMTFYKYFDNKWDIAKTVIDLLFDEGIQHYFTILKEQMSFHQKLEKLLTLSTVQIHSFGSAIFDDVLKEDSPLHAHFMERQKMTRELSVDFFKRAQQEGHISSNTKMPVLLFMLDRSIDLLNHPEFIKIMPAIEDRATELAALFFYGFARPETKING